MTVAEVREIREKNSIKWVGLSLEQRNAEIKKGANQIQAQINEKRKKNLSLNKV